MFSCLIAIFHNNIMIIITWVFLFSIAAYSLLVTPQTVPELEGDLEANFFCRENNNSYASPRAIVWQDPWGNVYIPGSLSIEGNSRISADGSRLQIVRVVRNDAGIYRCRRNNNPADFAEGNLLVHGMFVILKCIFSINMKYYTFDIQG